MTTVIIPDSFFSLYTYTYTYYYLRFIYLANDFFFAVGFFLGDIIVAAIVTNMKNFHLKRKLIRMNAFFSFIFSKWTSLLSISISWFFFFVILINVNVKSNDTSRRSKCPRHLSWYFYISFLFFNFFFNFICCS